MRFDHSIANTALVALASAGMLQAGARAQVLDDRLNMMGPAETVKVLVELEDQYPITALDQRLRMEGATRQQRHEAVVTALQAFACESQAGLLDWLVANEPLHAGSHHESLWITNAVQVTGNRELLEGLLTHPAVARIELLVDPPAEPIRQPSVRPTPRTDRTVSQNLRAIHAPEAWAMGYTGAGTLICTLGGGVDGHHPALAAGWRGNTEPRAECYLDLVDPDSLFHDSGGAGTRATGLLAGIDSATGDTTGVAFGAQWIAAKAMTSPVFQDAASVFRVMHALQWALDPDGDPRTVEDVPDVIDNSWTVYAPFNGSDYADAAGFLDQAIEACEAGGIVLVFSSGVYDLTNPGRRTFSRTSSFATGAVDVSDGNTIQPIPESAHGMVGNSNPALRIKPEVCAPGHELYTTLPGGGYGTSDDIELEILLATAQVSGVVALMREANPDLDAGTIKRIMMDTATDLGVAGEDAVFGHGLVNAEACLQAVLSQHGRIEGTVTGAGQPLDAAVILSGSGSRTASGAAGHYSLGLPANAPDTLLVECFGYESQSLPVTLGGGETVIREFQLVPRPVSRFSGVVLGQDLQPLPGAIIRIPSTTVCDTAAIDGSFAMDLFDTNELTFQVWAAGHGELETSVAIDGDTTHDFIIPGLPHFQPTGPDAYGYRIFDSNDPGGPAFEWNSIAGLSNRLPFSGSEAQHWVPLPFPVRYYGLVYTSVNILGNGFICFEYVPLEEMHGTEPVPSPDVPNRCVFASRSLVEYEDDLTTSSAWTRHDQDRGEFTIEFRPAGSSCGFQIVILDSGLRPTPTGDTEFILNFLPETVSWFIIGLENTTGAIGVQYARQNVYADTATPLDNGGSLLISTNPGGLIPCTDEIPPVIESVSELEDTSQNTGVFPVRAHIFNECGNVDVVLEYSIGEGSWVHSPMQHGGGSVYMANIVGPFPYYSDIGYRVRVEDTAGQSSESALYSFRIMPRQVVFTDSFSTGSLGSFQSIGEQDDTAGSTWSVLNDVAVAQTWTEFNCSSPPYAAVIQSEAIDCSAYDEVRLSWWYSLDSWWEDCGPFHGGFAQYGIGVSSGTGPTTTVGSHSLVNDEDNWRLSYSRQQEADISAFAAGEEDVRLHVWMNSNSSYSGTLRIAHINLFRYIQEIHLSIDYTIVGNRVRLNWSDHGPAARYNLYTAPAPDGPWTLQTTVTVPEADLPLSLGNRFFRVREELTVPLE